jgi:RHS repeat-associated protein
LETGLDFAEARYYNNIHGRFTAVDPLLASGQSGNPQSFNRYAYTMNQPLTMTDKTGLQTQPAAD